MKASLWKLVRGRIGAPGSSYSVCAWCRRVYTPKIIMADKLSDAQYAEIKSHGICPECKRSQLTEMRKNPGRRWDCGTN